MDDRAFGAEVDGGPRRGPRPPAAATSTAAPTRRSPRPTPRSSTIGSAPGQPRLRATSATSTAPASRSSSGSSPTPAATAGPSGRVGLTEHYREIFRITRLSDFMEIVEGDAA